MNYYGKIWQNYDFKKAEERVLELQCKLTKMTIAKKTDRIKQLQNKIVYSSEAKMLAVRKVTEISKSSAGVDGIVWRKDSEKMRGAILLNNMEYKANPLKYFVFQDTKTGKERSVGSPTNYDRAMQVLYSYALEPVIEARADRKSFAFRKGRSAEQAHACIMDCFTDSEKAEWVLITDVKSYYNSISHKWLLNNVPINRHILKEFLSSGYIMNGELFYRDDGISLGCNLSTILGNFALDGLQKCLYGLQGNIVKDYKNGYCIRFADDICVSARTKKDAEKFLEEIKKFVAKRGLQLSDNKTRIINIKKEGFEFLARFYLYQDGFLKCVPSDRAVQNFINEMEELIFNNKKSVSQKKLIQKINAKITGFTTYHKCEDSSEVFKYLDVVINALLLKFMKAIYPNSTLEQLQKKYWKNDSIRKKYICYSLQSEYMCAKYGRYNFS